MLAIILFLLGVGFLSGILPFVAGVVRCGNLPVSAESFAGGSWFVLPGERGYGPSPFPFKNEYYCTRDEAERAGFQHSVLTELGAKEQEAQARAFREARKFSPSSVPFGIYSPKYVPAGYTKFEFSLLSRAPNFLVVQPIAPQSRDHEEYLQLRQGALGSYEECSKAEPCTIIGRVPSGEEIYKNSKPTYSIKFQKSYVSLSSNRPILTDDEAIKILSSLEMVR